MSDFRVLKPDTDPRLLPDVDGRALVLRLLYLLDCEVQIDAPDATVCGEYNLVATGLTAEEIMLLKFLLHLPFRVKFWPFEANLAREAVASLYVKMGL